MNPTYTALQKIGPMTIKQVMATTGLAKKTVENHIVQIRRSDLPFRVSGTSLPAGRTGQSESVYAAEAGADVRRLPSPPPPVRAPKRLRLDPSRPATPWDGLLR